MKKSDLRKLIKKVIQEQAPWVKANIKQPSNRKETVECIQDYDCGSAGDNPQCCNSGFCGPCGASMGKHGANINENPSVDERKNVGKGPKKTIMCCCALSAPNLTACVGPFDGCSDCCLAGVSDSCGGQESPLYTITKHR